MSAQTLIIFGQSELQKHLKTLKNASKYWEYFKIVFYMFQMQNDVQSLHNWQFQSSNFQKLAKIVLEYLFWKKSQPKVLWKSKVVKISPWVKNFTNWQKRPLNFEFWQNKSLGI
jgi:hypothetical protein